MFLLLNYVLSKRVRFCVEPMVICDVVWRVYIIIHFIINISASISMGKSSWFIGEDSSFDSMYSQIPTNLYDYT